MRRLCSVVVAIALTGTVVLGCGDVQGSAAGATGLRVDHFDAQRAWRIVERQLAYGQRPAGSAQLRRLARSLRPLLPNGRFERLPGEPGVRNVVGTLPGRKPGILVGAHYDTLVEPPGFVGANNGAAGTAVVIEAARALSRMRRPAGAPEVRFALFDGEEPAAGLPEESTDFYSEGLRGSRAYVARHPDRTATMLLLDYVGNRGLRLPRDGSSTPALWIACARRHAGLAPPASSQPRPAPGSWTTTPHSFAPACRPSTSSTGAIRATTDPTRSTSSPAGASMRLERPLWRCEASFAPLADAPRLAPRDHRQDVTEDRSLV